MTWLARFLSGRDTTPSPLLEKRVQLSLRLRHEEFVAHERAIAETQRLRAELEKITGPRETGVIAWWET